MKIKYFLIILSFFVTLHVQAQWPYRAVTVKFGSYSPKDIGASYRFNTNVTFQLSSSDEFGLGIDYFGKHEKDILTLKEKYLVGPILETEIQTVSKTNVHLIPIYGIYTFRLPLSPRNTAFFSVTAGYDFLISKFKDYYNEFENVTNQYKGFAWSLGSGFMYRLNHQIVVVGEASYNFSKVSRDIPTPDGAPIQAVVDISGFSFQIGVRRSIF